MQITTPLCFRIYNLELITLHLLEHLETYSLKKIIIWWKRNLWTFFVSIFVSRFLFKHLHVDAKNGISLLSARKINGLNVDQGNFFFIPLVNWSTKLLMKVEGSNKVCSFRSITIIFTSLQTFFWKREC